MQKIGENMTIRRFKRLQAKGKLALYLHGAKIGVLVDYEGPRSSARTSRCTSRSPSPST